MRPINTFNKSLPFNELKSAFLIEEDICIGFWNLRKIQIQLDKQIDDIESKYELLVFQVLKSALC